MARIDAHLHLWRDPELYPWLTSDLEVIRRPFAAEEGRQASRAFGCDRAILVQAADADADTDHLLALAAAHDWIIGVVGWVPLTDPSAAEARLAALADRPLVGIRALIHDQPDPGLLDRPEVRETLALIAAQGLAFDVPDAFPDQLPAAIRLAEAMPGLRIVLDHLGKPPAGDQASWRAAVSDLAAAGTTFAKLSGLHLGGRLLPEADALAAWSHALERFGEERILLGSDAPMPMLGDGVDALAGLTERLLASTGHAHDRFGVAAAAAAYRL